MTGKANFKFPSMPADIWLTLQQTQQILRNAGIDRSDQWLRSVADRGEIPIERDDTGDRKFSLLGLGKFIEKYLKQRKETRREQKKTRR